MVLDHYTLAFDQEYDLESRLRQLPMFMSTSNAIESVPSEVSRLQVKTSANALYESRSER